MLHLMERDPALSLLDSLLQTFGYCVPDIHRSEALLGKVVDRIGLE
jgi:hypothetical protein